MPTLPPMLTRARAAAGPELARARRLVADSCAPVSALGWTVLAGALGCWLLGWLAGWVELTLIAAASLVLLLGCALLTVGRTRLRVSVDVEPGRVVVGAPAAGQVQVVNAGRGALLPVLLELPVGPGVARFDLPLLRPGAGYDELYVAPTERRGVVEIGPATTVRGDPFGLLRRTVTWTEVVELFVHPRTVSLEPLGAGLLRDLEGQTTNDVSMSDLAFHTLRDYVPGDDRRYIHWRSSAKAGRFLVRQFLDTRRSHFTTVVDSDTASYPGDEDFETAVSVAASIALRALVDEQDVTVIAGEHVTSGKRGPRVLDTFSRVTFGGPGLRDLAARASRTAVDTSIAILITGALTDHLDLHRAAAYFPPETHVLGVRVDPGAPTGLRRGAGLTVANLRSLDELPALLAGVLG